jgi:peptide/nickel transport system substrate-binding protein
MKRRTFAAGLAIAASPWSRPAIAHGTARVLRFVPQGNLNTPDPMVSFAQNSRNNGYLIWDTLFARTAVGEIRPQMLSGYDVSDDERVTGDSRCVRT